MTKKTANRFINSNEEYTKLKGSDSSTLREQPKQQKAGNTGYQLPELERWTTDEIRQHCNGLGISDAESMNRDELLSELNKRLKS